MDIPGPLFEPPVIQGLGWVLLHFLWQGILVAVLLAGVNVLLRQHAAQVRYTIACTAMLLLMVLPIATLYLIKPSSSSAISRTQILHRTESIGSTPLSENILRRRIRNYR